MSRLFLLNKRADYAEKPTPSHVACVVCNVVMLSLLPTHYVPLFVLSGQLVLFFCACYFVASVQDNDKTTTVKANTAVIM